MSPSQSQSLDLFTPQSQSQNQYSSQVLTQSFDLIKPFNNLPNLVIDMIMDEDKKFKISSPLSYTITYFWNNNSSEKIELVDCSQLWKYREYNRLKVGKHNPPNKNNFNKLKSINKIGFYEPLSLIYYASTGETFVCDGNHRLTWAKNIDKKIKWLPVKVHVFQKKQKSETNKYNIAPIGAKPFPNTIKIAPSEIGFKVYQKYPLHPYYPNNISDNLKKFNIPNYPSQRLILDLIDMDNNSK
jgi:hypothetical protein